MKEIEFLPVHYSVMNAVTTYGDKGWSIACSMVCSREYLSKENDSINRNSTKRTQADTHTPRASPEKQIDLMIGTGEDPCIIASSVCLR